MKVIPEMYCVQKIWYLRFHLKVYLKHGNMSDILIVLKRISGIMVNVLVLSVVDRGFERRSSQTKNLKIGICSLSMQH
jgi:hypothetical protein